MRSYFADAASAMKSILADSEGNTESKDRGELFLTIRDFMKSDSEKIQKRSESNAAKRAKSDEAQRFKKWYKRRGEIKETKKQQQQMLAEKQQLLADKEKR